MKSILTVCAFFTWIFTQAQVTPETQQDNVQDKLQQEPPRDAQRRIENAARQNDPKQQYNEAQRKQEELMKKEMERSTGQEDKNPAEDNPKTVAPATMSEPLSKPVKREN